MRYVPPPQRSAALRELPAAQVRKEISHEGRFQGIVRHSLAFYLITSAAARPEQAMRILIVEDEPLIAMMLVDALESGGHEVLGPAKSASEALAICEAAPPDLALLDVNLARPDLPRRFVAPTYASDGVALARALFAKWQLPVLFATAYPVEARAGRDVALGIVHKPYDTSAVLRSVDVARAMMAGRNPVDVPQGLEIFTGPSLHSL